MLRYAVLARDYLLAVVTRQQSPVASLFRQLNGSWWVGKGSDCSFQGAIIINIVLSTTGQTTITYTTVY